MTQRTEDLILALRKLEFLHTATLILLQKEAQRNA